MEKATLVLPVFAGCVTLARKKRGVGAGLYNGYGGKLERGEGSDPRRGAIRKFQQEARVVADVLHLDLRAEVRFYEAGRSTFDCSIFLLHEWKGEIQESEEMGPPELFMPDKLPYDQMLPADREIIPMVLQRSTPFRARCYYTTGNTKLLKFEHGPLF